MISPRVMTASSTAMELKAEPPAIAVSSAVKTTGTVQLCTGTNSFTAKRVVFRRTRTVAAADTPPTWALPRMDPSSA